MVLLCGASVFVGVRFGLPTNTTTKHIGSLSIAQPPIVAGSVLVRMNSLSVSTNLPDTPRNSTSKAEHVPRVRGTFVFRKLI